MYTQSALSVNPSRNSAPEKIIMMSAGEPVVWPARDIAGTLEGVYLWVSDMTGIGWTAVRVGDAIVLHPVDLASTPQHLRRRA